MSAMGCIETGIGRRSESSSNGTAISLPKSTEDRSDALQRPLGKRLRAQRIPAMWDVSDRVFARVAFRSIPAALLVDRNLKVHA